MMPGPVDVERKVRGIPDPVLRAMYRAYLRGHNQIWYGVKYDDA